jgi:hypothetical protein
MKSERIPEEQGFVGKIRGAQCTVRAKAMSMEDFEAGPTPLTRL